MIGLRDEESAIVWGLAVGFLLGVALAVSGTRFCMNESWEQSAIKAGAGEYDSISGKFQWKEKKGGE